MTILDQAFFNRKTLVVARDLIGKYVVRQDGHTLLAYRITEVEAYIGEQDLACHSAKGRTRRTEVMFGPPGRLYLYLIYGMYWMLNIVTEQTDHPSAILIRGVASISGPGRVARALKLDASFNDQPATKATGLWFEDRGGLTPKISRTPRIGIDYAGPIWSAKLYRFVVKD